MWIKKIKLNKCDWIISVNKNNENNKNKCDWMISVNKNNNDKCDWIIRTKNSKFIMTSEKVQAKIPQNYSPIIVRDIFSNINLIVLYYRIDNIIRQYIALD